MRRAKKTNYSKAKVYFIKQRCLKVRALWSELDITFQKTSTIAPTWNGKKNSGILIGPKLSSTLKSPFQPWWIDWHVEAKAPYPKSFHSLSSKRLFWVLKISKARVTTYEAHRLTVFGPLQQNGKHFSIWQLELVSSENAIKNSSNNPF